MPRLPHIGRRYQAPEKEVSIVFIALPQYLYGLVWLRLVEGLDILQRTIIDS
jgi:hypothetical protein